MTDTIDQQAIFDFIISGAGDSYYMNKESRVARKVMIELIKAGRAEFILLRDDEVSGWWNKIYSGVQEKFEKHQEKIRMYNLKLDAYNKLTAEERKSLGIRKPVKPKEL